MNKNKAVLLFFFLLLLLAVLKPSFLNGQFFFAQINLFFILVFLFNFLFSGVFFVVVSFFYGLFFGFFTLHPPFIFVLSFLLTAILAQKAGSLLQKNSVTSFSVSFIFIFFIFQVVNYILLMVLPLSGVAQKMPLLFLGKGLISLYFFNLFFALIIFLFFRKAITYEKQAIF